MKNVYTLLLIVAVFLLSTGKGTAQTDQQDSLSLADLYSAANGAGWTTSTNWLTGTVDTWFGITVSGGRVTAIVLNNNNLSGVVPGSIDSLDALEKLDLSENAITVFPALANTSALDTLNIASNRLTFEDILPNIAIADSLFTYAPQDSLENPVDTAIFKGTGFLFSLTQDTADALDNSFQWKKNNGNLPGQDQPLLTLNCVTLNDSGNYTCAITNADAPALTLYRRKLHLVINDVIANAGIDATLCAENYQAAANIPVIGTGLWSLVSGNVSIADFDDPFTQITGIQPGSNILRWSISNGGCTNISFDDVVISRNSVPSVPTAGPDKTVCTADETLAAEFPSVGAGSWSVISGQGVIADALNPLSTVSNLSVGENIFRWQISNGVCQSVFDEVKIIRQLALASTSAGTDTALCPHEDSIHATLPVTGTGWWSTVSGGGFIDDMYAPNAFVTNMPEGANVFRWTTDNSCQLPVWDEVTVTVYPAVQAEAGTYTDYYLSSFIQVNLGGSPTAWGGSGSFTYQWDHSGAAGELLSAADTSNPVYQPLDTGIHEITLYVEDTHGCYTHDTAQVHVVKPDEFAIPTLFTPNGDGRNDNFVIPGAESYPENQLTVIDRFGQIIFEASPYENDWNGETSYFSGEALPETTVYYIFKPGEGKDPLTGYIVIKK